MKDDSHGSGFCAEGAGLHAKALAEFYESKISGLRSRRASENEPEVREALTSEIDELTQEYREKLAGIEHNLY